MTDKKTSEAAAALGRIGGSKKTAVKAESSRENGKKGGRPRRVVVCRNCGTKAKIGHICAMEKAGFEIRHLEYKECGQKTLEEKV